jgi:hypothetical protein
LAAQQGEGDHALASAPWPVCLFAGGFRTERAPTACAVVLDNGRNRRIATPGARNGIVRSHTQSGNSNQGFASPTSAAT